MKLMWLGYLVYSFGNCAMKLCIETDLSYRQSEMNGGPEPAKAWTKVA